MIVYGKYGTKYQLNSQPYKRDYDGEYFRVNSMLDKQAKIYFKNFRTSDQESQVLSAATGNMPIQNDYPDEPVYLKGKFVGYISAYEQAEMPEGDAVTSPVAMPHPIELTSAGVIAACVVIGILLSVLFVTVIFDRITAGCSKNVVYYNFNGIPMMIGGLLALGFCTYRFKDRGIMPIVLTLPAFIIGGGIVFLAIYLLVKLFETVISLIVPIITAIIVIAMIILGIKWLLKSIGIR